MAPNDSGAKRPNALGLAETCLERIAARDGVVKAWECVDPDQVLAQARMRDREAPRSALHGVPVGIKDIIDTRDLVTAYGSPIYAGHRPRRDAACVTRLREAGAIILGKTVTVEFAAFHWARTRNPRDLARTPGGSSSGSAAAVADGMTPLALGTQTGGSTLRPAAYCGVVGYKPSFGLVDLRGVKPLAPSQDTIGVFGRNVAEVMALVEVLSGKRPGTTPPRAPRIGICAPGQWPAKLDPAMSASMEKGAARLSRAGARVRELVLPPPFERLFDAQRVVNEYEAWRALRRERLDHPQLLSPTLSARLVAAGHRTAEAYREAGRLLAAFRRALRPVFARFDLLLLPAVTGVAPVGLENTGDATFLRVWTALHAPAISLPVFHGARGLPMGLQAVGPVGADRRLLADAEWIYRVLRD